MINVENLKPFPKFCYTIGMIPSSYKESLTYEEQLIWFCNYLENTVIPTVNNNGMAVEEIQNLLVQLKDYVDNYFNNLDVQEEINNKLDEMTKNGELTNIIKNYVDPLFNTLSNNVTNQLNQMENKINSVTNGTPIPVSSISEMTDTSKIYVLTSSGHWYYYNGTTWVDGGTYQTMGIAPEEIEYIMLDETLKKMYIEDLQNITLPQPLVGYAISVSNKTITFPVNQYFSYYQIDISNYVGKTLYFNAQTYGAYNSCIITDAAQNVIYYKPTTNVSTKRDESGYIKVESGMKYMYLMANSSQSNVSNYAFCNLMMLNDLKLKLNYTKLAKLNPINSLKSWYIKPDDATDSLGQLKLSSVTDSSCVFKTYKMSAGLKYKIDSINAVQYAKSGFVICDNDFNVITNSINLFETDTRFTYEFTAEFNGFICVTDDDKYDRWKTYVYAYNSFENQELDLSNLKIGFTGDSICHGDGYLNAYAKILHDNYGLVYQNIAQSGGHLAHDRDDVFVISEHINELDSDCDAYIIEGGINDRSNSVPLGTLSTGYTSEITNTTFIGALETIFRALYTNFPGKKFAFLIVHNVTTVYDLKNNVNVTWAEYRDAIYEVCKKYGVHVIDIGANTSFNTYSDYMRNTYTGFNGDGLHPNKLGYEKFYVPMVKDWIVNSLL